MFRDKPSSTNPPSVFRFSFFAFRSPLSRPGSVLILVVALLVLMALIGTAYISTARIDRYNSTQNTKNTQADLIVDAVRDMIVGRIRDDLYVGTDYRPAADPLYAHWDSTVITR